MRFEEDMKAIKNHYSIGIILGIFIFITICIIGAIILISLACLDISNDKSNTNSMSCNCSYCITEEV